MASAEPAMPYARLSAWYFFHFGALGALLPFFGPWLRDQGFSPAAIGLLLAIMAGTKIVAPNVFGLLADRRGERMPAVRLAGWLTVLGFLGIFWADGVWSMALVIALFSFFWNAPLPLVEAVTFNHLGSAVGRYASVRLWGSVGFILAVLLLGWWQESAGSAVVPWVTLVLMAGIWLAALVTPDRGHPHGAGQGVPLRRLLRQPELIGFFATCVLMQASHGAYYAFYSIHLEQHGYPSLAIGALWAFGVTMEVLVFLVMHRLLARFGARRLLLGALALATLRWLLIGTLVDLVAVQIFAQALHAASFGVFHAAAIHLTHHYFPGPTQGRGQALYNSIAFGVGGAIGSLLSGALWSGGGAPMTFTAAAGLAGAGLVVAGALVDRARRW